MLEAGSSTTIMIDKDDARELRKEIKEMFERINCNTVTEMIIESALLYEFYALLVEDEEKESKGV